MPIFRLVPNWFRPELSWSRLVFNWFRLVSDNLIVSNKPCHPYVNLILSPLITGCEYSISVPYVAEFSGCVGNRKVCMKRAGLYEFYCVCGWLYVSFCLKALHHIKRCLNFHGLSHIWARENWAALPHKLAHYSSISSDRRKIYMSCDTWILDFNHHMENSMLLTFV